MARIAFVPYPPTSFPYRDLLVLEQLPLERDHRLCEIGVGSGETTARLARLCADVTGFEISMPTVEALRYLEKRHRNLHLVSADVTDEEALAHYADRFDRALSCDTLEHVPDPAGFFRGVAALLAPDGEFLVTFPNEPAAIMHGITRFDSPLELHQHIAEAGLTDVRMGAARLTAHAERVAEALGWKPLSLARGLMRRGRELVERARGGGTEVDAAGDGANGHDPHAGRDGHAGGHGHADAHGSGGAPPQTFEETRFFRYMRVWRQLSPAVNLYWYGVLRLMSARGPSFDIDWDFCDTPFTDCQVFVVGRKPGSKARSGGGFGSRRSMKPESNRHAPTSETSGRVEALTSALPFVTIAMPCFNEERHIETCIRSVQAQDYPADRMEILIADGRSSDRTREILAALSAEDPRIRVVDNPERLQAPGLNRIIREARGDVIVRMDVHCEYAPRYVAACVEVMRRTGADNVGGAQRARATTRFQRALCAALTSPLGVGGAAYRSADKEGYVDTVFLGAFRRSVFEAVGLYDEAAVTNEDAELNQRLLAAGGKIYLSRDIEVHYFPRESFRKLATQYFKYGKGRARSLLKHRRLPKLRPMVPFLLVVGGAGLLITAPVQPFTLPAFAAYALATGIEALRVGRQAGWSAVPTVWAIFPTLHVAHGLGFARGLLDYGLRPDWDRS